jgi:hypothetical protein
MQLMQMILNKGMTGAALPYVIAISRVAHSYLVESLRQLSGRALRPFEDVR